ncbi:ER-associated protein degradation protein [Phytophthora pseudosyringae]|uniref:Derlin n=1 Tax=Phytophthora pseudosyringae TaxID=221518 RepID=A0A8T1WDN3_9STRA|nr:ER-associated protein degradation protein [Phytophthora pseudosyringae]
MAGSIEAWYYGLPYVTRFYLSVCFGSTLLSTLGFLNPQSLYLDFDLVWQRFQLWRLTTCFMFLGSFSFPFVMQLMILTNYSSRLEEDPFPGGGGPTADYAFMLFFGAAVLWVVAFFMGIPFLGTSLIFMIVYVWSRRNPTAPVAIWGFRFEGLYLPWALIAFTVLVGGNPMMDVFGVIAGHLYYFLLEVLPATKGWNLLQTPAVLYVTRQFFASGCIQLPDLTVAVNVSFCAARTCSRPRKSQPAEFLSSARAELLAAARFPALAATPGVPDGRWARTKQAQLLPS